MRGGSARWTADIHVAEGGSLCWQAQPFVVASGADVAREVEVDLAPAAVLLLRETLVLGRSGEAGGVLLQRLRSKYAGAPLLVEGLGLDGANPRLGLLGRNRVLDTVTMLGARGAEMGTPDGVARFELEGPGTVYRYIGEQVHLSPLPRVWQTVRALSDGIRAEVGRVRPRRGAAARTA